MAFKDIKIGQPIFLFDRNTIELKQGKVINTSNPYVNSGFNNGGMSGGFSPVDYSKKVATMVVDITAETPDGQKIYTFNDSSEIGYTGTLAISCNRQSILDEINGQLAQSEQTLAKMDYYKECAEKCKAIINDFDPKAKEKRETDERLSALEKNVSEMTKNISEMSRGMTDFFSQFSKQQSPQQSRK